MVASTLLNLKDHREQNEEDRYSSITSTFHDLFPQFRIRAVDTSPGANRPDVIFTSVDTNQDLSLSQVSAGIQESLTLLTNIISRVGRLYFIEHPENHLHPHAIRAFSNVVEKAAEHNQFVVITHSPYFVSPTKPGSLRRFWLLQNTGTQVKSISQETLRTESGTYSTLSGQVATVFRLLEAREAVFSRATLLDEDESQYEFIRAIAPVSGFDLDSRGISILYTGGQGGSRTYIAVMRGLGIPFIALKDLPWGNNSMYPPSQFFSLGQEIEDFLDSHDLADVRQVAIRLGGSGSKRRTAMIMGGLITKSQIPSLFTEIVQAIADMAERGTQVRNN